MEYIKLKNSDITVSRLCMGGCPMGGHGWGNVQESELIEAVHSALDKGITFFDTADTYGLGQSELTLGKDEIQILHDLLIRPQQLRMLGHFIGEGIQYAQHLVFLCYF